MEGYLGETKVEINKTKYAMYGQQDWVMLWIEMYRGTDGSHHKDWLTDQIARILKGTKVNLRIAKWKNGTENERFGLEEPPKAYWDWVKEMKDGEDGENTYDYDFGIAP
tara:strand:- start:58 stop:384 length:327 start_codon:yes stop_codon:yes gene_type:complete